MINKTQVTYFLTKLQIGLVVILLSFQTAIAQTKEIKGDTAYWFKSNTALQKALHLKPLETSADEFNFRISYYGQVVEITKDSNDIYGAIINYTYHTIGHKRDTLFNKIALSKEKAESIYNFIISSEILKLPTDKEIKDWQHGFDGITYVIEHSDKKNYWLKNYWTPSAQDDLPEALTVLSFLENLNDSLDLKTTYANFENGLPKHGCYNSGGMMVRCYASNTIELGYSGATKMPYGFLASYSASYIGRTKVNSGIALQYNFDNNNFYHLNFLLSKWNIINKSSQFPDFVVYNYQNRRINIDRANNKFQNHQFEYGINLKNDFSVRTGIDYLINNHKKIGMYLCAYRYFSEPHLSTILSSSIFNNQINYKAQILKSVYINRRLAIRRITLGLTYEEFMNYKDVYINLQMSL